MINGGYVLSGIQKVNPKLECSGTEVHIKGLKLAKERLLSLDKLNRLEGEIK